MNHLLLPNAFFSFNNFSNEKLQPPTWWLSRLLAFTKIYMKIQSFLHYYHDRLVLWVCDSVYVCLCNEEMWLHIFDSSILAFAVEYAISHFYLSFSWKKQKRVRRGKKRRADKIERVHGICVLLHHVSMRILKNVQAFHMVMKFMY